MEEKAVYVTQEARQLQNEGTLATYIVKGVLRNIHGDWAKKEITLKGDVWRQNDRETGTEDMMKGDQTTSLNTQKDKRTKKEREVTKEAHCFPRKNGHALIPLGGPRGYICGMFRAAARTRGWNKQGNKYFGALSFVDNGGFTVSPDWFETNGEEVKMKPFFVKEAKGEIFFEYIEKVPFEVKVSVMKNHMPEDMALQLIGDLERLPIGPKRRGALEIASIQKLN